MGDSTDYYNLAIKNIAEYGDTDIFPYPVENALFFDDPGKIKSLLEDIDKNFNTWLSNYPIEAIQTCVPVGYTGYRWATLIDPIWNAYFLAQVLKISEKLEEKRISIDKDTVYSYRINFGKDSGKIFNSEINWRKFYEKSALICEGFNYVVKFDISDFYNRIYHHRLENALKRTEADADVIKKILTILQDISGNVSYGLPIGGNASRILAEILLNSMDQMLLIKRIKFCRYVDDYILFADSYEDAYKKLNLCAEFLLKNEGLALQKNKTQIMLKSEFISHVRATLEGEDREKNKEKVHFMNLHLHYDPYSITAAEDYETLKSQLNQYDIVSLIKSEIRKSRIHQAFGKQLLNAVRYLDNEQLNLAFIVIGENLDKLYPIYPSVMILAHKKLLLCEKSTIEKFIGQLCELVENDSYIIQSDNNASYTARVLSLVNLEISTQAIAKLSERTSELIRLNCLYAMINLKNEFWLSDRIKNFLAVGKFERRTLIAASYFLGDEGQHWRQHSREKFSKFETVFKDWVSSKSPLQNNWKFPL